ncbi:MAG: hypothetical protein GTN36_04865 [Candidatus Aenigmarchaeota archaeon]|nr:hypothetical protein [Candidatus Aenigmarchaeota archaeon]
MIDKPIFELGKKPGIPDNDQEPASKGHILCKGPPGAPGREEIQNRYFNLNFTGPPGSGSGIYFNLLFLLPKLGWWVEKADEWIEVPPTHKEYYERTMATKQMLESTIKTGLTSAAQAVADFELMSHDIRKYREILTYFHEGDEHVLKSMFIDQVDIHTDLPGQPIALRSIVSKWPTVIADFMRLDDKDTIPKKVADKYDISQAEAVILVTKNKLYKKWKILFGDAAKQRYELLKGLIESRRKSIEEYKEWLKPYIARFKMTKIGGERSKVRARTLRTFTDVTGMSTFANKIRIFAWKAMRFEEHRKPAAEVVEDFILYPYDDYVREKVILDPENGLAYIYPWLRNDRKYCSKCKKYYSPNTLKCAKCGSLRLKNKKYADEIVETEIIPAWREGQNGLSAGFIYYMFFDIEVTRLGTWLRVGELEDITFYTRVFVLSQNALLAKILELKCRDLELERYIDEMLGIKFEDRDIADLVKEEFPTIFKKPKEELTGFQNYIKELGETFSSYTNIFKKIKLPKSTRFMFFKAGPYETDLKERITKHYLKYAAVQLNGMRNFIKQKMGVE